MMCDYERDPKMSYGENRIMAAMFCKSNNEQLGHCVVYGRDGTCNVPGYAPKRPKPKRKGK